jgi:apolipoprotein D and lipocalin family protein
MIRLTKQALNREFSMRAFRVGLMSIAFTAVCGASQAAEPAPLQSLPALDVAGYMGTWYQVALFPNWFQRQCVSDTSATYSSRPDGSVNVLNRCRLADGRWDEAQGLARPVGALAPGTLSPARLEVSFLPSFLRWMPVGWGSYWVIQRPEDGRYAVISEPSRKYLWVLSRQPRLSAEDEVAIRTQLQAQGFQDLSAWSAHPHTP